jgi:hypothetical protein
MSTVGSAGNREGIDRLAKVLIIALAGLLGVALFAVPDRMAAALGLAGTDEFAYRSGGAAFLGYAVAFAFGWNAAAGTLRVLWLATLGAAAVTVVAGLVAFAAGHTGGILVPLIVLGAIAVAAVAWYEVVPGPVLPRATGRQFTPWFVAFLGWGVIASALFGIGGLVLGSTFGSIAGFAGGDDPVYRFAGAATIGILVASILALRTQDWSLIRLPVLMSFVTNVVTLLGGALYISHGGVPPVAYLIAAAAIFNIGGLGLALTGRR